MPNITYINSFILAATIMAPGLAQAEQPVGCYERNYTQAHLAKNPNQVVAQIALRFGKSDTETVALMSVLTANQGHAQKAGNGGKLFEQFLLCSATNGDNWRCSVECDGGSLEVVQLDGEILKFSTQYLLVGATDECGGLVDLAEKQDQKVTYKLTRVADSQCAIN